MNAADLTSEIIDGIRTAHASGHFTREEAAARIRVAGFGPIRTAEEVDAILALPVTPEMFDKFGTWPCGEVGTRFEGEGDDMQIFHTDPCRHRRDHDGRHSWATDEDDDED